MESTISRHMWIKHRYKFYEFGSLPGRIKLFYNGLLNYGLLNLVIGSSCGFIPSITAETL